MSARRKKEDWVRIGEVGVDSGQMMLTDPGYIDSEWKKEDFEHRDPDKVGEYSYAGCSNTTLGDEEAQAGQLYYAMGHAGVGVVFNTGCGDGTYNAYARYVDDPNWGRRIAEVKVVFMDDDE